MPSLMMVNPKRRKATRKKRRTTAVARRRTTHRRRRNPIRSTGMMATLQNAAVGASGALVVDVAMSKLPLPANLKTGPALPAVKGGVSLLVGMLVGKILKKASLGKQLAEGGLTVAIHDMAKPMLSNVIPGGLAGSDDLMGYDLMGYEDTMSNDMGGYDEFDDMSGIDDFEGEILDYE